MENKRIYLIGFMGAGKTTLGKKLANKLGFAFCDTDQMIESKYKLTVYEYFMRFGESSFREEETKIINHLIESNDNVVVATGGGLPVFNNNMALLNRSGLTCYLKRPAKELYQRLKMSKSTRPLLKGLDDDKLLAFVEKGIEKREKYYKLSNYTLKREEQSVETIINKLKLIP